MSAVAIVKQFIVVAVWVTAAITATGAVLGAGIWPLVGLIAGANEHPGVLAIRGAQTLGFYFFLWAPATGIVVATMREWRRRHPDSQ